MDWEKGENRMTDSGGMRRQRTSGGRKPIRRALISVYDKTGLPELARGLHDAGVAIVSTGSTAKTIAGAGVPVTPVEERHRLPRGARRPGQDPAPARARRAARRPPQARARRRARGARHRGVRPRRGQPVSVHRDGRLRCRRRRVRRADRHRRPVDGAGVREEPPQRGRGRRSARLRRRAGGGPGGRVHARGAKDAWRRWHFGTPPSTTSPSPAGWARCWPPRSPRSSYPPGTAGRGAAPRVLRYGENPHQQAALYRDDAAWPGLAQAEQLHGKEMSYNNYTDADAAWRAAFDHEQICVAIIKHANPCGIAISSVSVADAHRKAHECDPLSAFGGVIAANTAVSVEMAETVADIFTEVIIAPAYEDGRGGSACAQEEHPRAGGIRAVGRRHRVPADQRWPAAAAARRARRAGRRPGQLDAGDGSSPPTRPRSPTWSSRGGPAAR